jgi:L-fuconolactonase
MKELAALPNVVCKISGVATEADHQSWTREQLRPYVAHAIECFGFDRSLYGGDWHVLELAGTYPDWVDIVDWVTAGASAEERRKLFRDNTVRVYRLD